MTSARLLAAALLFCSLPAFAQDRQSSTPHLPVAAFSAFTTNSDSAATPSEPWRIAPDQTAELGAGQTVMDHIRVDQFRLDHGKVYSGARTFTFKTPAWNGSLDGDATCLTMRSYVVARDSKDSDSTHMTGYSTCQPSSRYRLKTTEERTVSVER